nr:riboflavin synthase [Leptolyngbya sp. FACHB-541]
MQILYDRKLNLNGRKTVFTGLIQTTGMIHSLGDDQLQISCGTTAPEWFLTDLAIGDSISVDGVCLTVTRILPNGFIATASPETLYRTTLGQLEGDAYVNLEASLQVGSKLGGHFVTGHVDGVGYLQASVQTANSWEMSFAVTDPRVTRYIVTKGSIAVNGVSLTVADCNSEGTWFKVAVIPLTYAETNLRHLKLNALVNLEGDVLGKYVEKFLRLGGDQTGKAIADLETLIQPANDGVSSAFLAEHGYL